MFIFIAVTAGIASAGGYTTGVYTDNGGDRLVISPTGTLLIQNGASTNLVDLQDTGKGDIWYVDSNVSGGDDDGTSWANAVGTIEEAVALCDPNDYIYVAQGHYEAMGAAADEIDLDIHGLTLRAFGNGALMPTLDYTGDVTGAFAVGADCITIINFRFHANVPDVNEAIEIEAGSTDLTLIGCVFDCETEGTDEFHECITSYGAASDRLKVIGCDFRMGAGAARSAIAFKDCDYAEIAYNKFAGDFAIADINNATTASNHITIHDNMIMNGTVGGAAGLNDQPCIELKSDTSGVIYNNKLICNVATPDAAIVGADMYCFNNVYSETEGGVSSASNSVEYWREHTTSVTLTGLLTPEDHLFDVDGGPILITSFVGVVVTAIDSNAATCGIEIDRDDTAADTELTTLVNIESDVLGTVYVFSNANPAVLTPLTPGTCGSTTLMTPWFCPEGMIEQANSAANLAGSITWYMTWRPLAAGITVTAQ